MDKKASGILVVLALLGSLAGACKTASWSREQEVEGLPDSPPPPSPGPPSADQNRIQREATELQIEQTCERPVQLLRRTVRLSFPERRSCSFEQSPNRPRQAGLLQAHGISLAELELPAQAEICELSMEAPSAKLRYRDFLILTLDQKVLYASHALLVQPLPQNAQGLFLWDFAKTVGAPISTFEGAPYCLAAAERCQFPAYGQEGPVVLRTNSVETKQLTADWPGKTLLAVNLITTGDKDDDDCFHSLLHLDLTIRYIKR